MQTNSSFILEIGNSSSEDSSSVGITLDSNGLHSVWIWICSAEEHAVPSYELSQEGLIHSRGNHAGKKGDCLVHQHYIYICLHCTQCDPH